MKSEREVNLVLKFTSAYILHQVKIQELGVFLFWLNFTFNIISLIFLSVLIPLSLFKDTLITPLPSTSLQNFHAIKCLPSSYQLWWYSAVLKYVSCITYLAVKV